MQRFDALDSLPPQSVDAEESILGGILLDREAIGRVADILPANAFYITAHKEIYKAALTLQQQGKPTDLMSVTTWLYDHELLEKVGGQSKLAQLVERTVSAVNVDRYAELVMEKYQRRQLIQAGNEIVQLGYETSVELETVLDQSEQKIFSLTQQESTQTVESAFDILTRIYNGLESKEVAHKTGLYDLDSIIGGLKAKKLYVVAGRSGMGKTQLAVFLAYQMLNAPQPVVFFSAEMDKDALMRRILACESGIDSQRIEERNLHDDEYAPLVKAIDRLREIPLYLDDTSGVNLTPTRIRSGIRKATAMYGKPGLIVLDYLQLLGSEAGNTNRVTELDRIANSCKAIAKEFDVPFVALAQINRSVEGQNNKRPSISQLRESGAIEQAADVILLLYRDDYYNPQTPDKDTVEIIVGKHRDGRTGTAKALFKPEVSHFLNLAKKPDKWE